MEIRALVVMGGLLTIFGLLAKLLRGKASRVGHKAGAIACGTHLVGVALTLLYISQLHDGQAGLLFVPWMLLDLPFSFVFMDLGVHPLVSFGLVGSAWWYLLFFLLWSRNERTQPGAPRDAASPRA